MVWVQFNIASFMDFSLIAHCLLSNKHNCRNGTGKNSWSKGNKRSIWEDNTRSMLEIHI